MSAFVAQGQKTDEPQARSILSDDFDSKRPAAKPSATRPRKVPHQHLRTQKSPLERKPSRKVDTTKGPKASQEPNTKAKATQEPNTKPALAMTEVGVTVWRLRPPKKGEEGEMFSVAVAENKREKWLAERFDPDQTFTPADKLRFGVESSKPGYLYIIDRETYDDGSFGAPYLLFPESLRDDNSVGPGTLVDVPPQQQSDPYFNIKPSRPGHNGELMTIIISSDPIDLRVERVGDGLKILDNDLLAEIEFGSEASIYTRSDGGDRFFSKTEADAAGCGNKSRQLVREKSEPCNTETRQLTREAPLPQAIYQVKSPKDKAGALFLRLAVR